MARSLADPTALTRQARYSRVLRWSDPSQPKYFCPLVRPDGLLWHEVELRGCVLHHGIRTATRSAPALPFKEQAARPAPCARGQPWQGTQTRSMRPMCPATAREFQPRRCACHRLQKTANHSLPREADRARPQTRSKDRKTNRQHSAKKAS
jgi:hypothetical protein